MVFRCMAMLLLSYVTFAEVVDRVAVAIDKTVIPASEILRLDSKGNRAQLAWDHHAILISRPTNIAFGGKDFDEIFIANFGRQTVTRAKIGISGQKLVNLL